MKALPSETELHQVCQLSQSDMFVYVYLTNILIEGKQVVNL